MSKDKTEDILKSILVELKAIETQLIISRYKDELMMLASKIEDEEVREKLMFIFKSDNALFEQKYNLQKKIQAMKEKEMAEEKKDDSNNGLHTGSDI